MSILDRARNELMARKGQYPAIAEATGLSYSWLCKLGQGAVRNPELRRIEQLIEYFDAHPRPSQVPIESARDL